MLDKYLRSDNRRTPKMNENNMNDMTTSVLPKIAVGKNKKNMMQAIPRQANDGR